jgi:toxin ParE1/3/4
MGQAKLMLLILDEAQKNTRDLRRYILRSFGVETWKHASAELTITFGNIR